MKNKNVRIVVGTAVGVIIAIFIGAMLNFHPFFGDDLVVREIQFCTFLICVVISVCTCLIIGGKRD